MIAAILVVIVMVGFGAAEAAEAGPRWTAADRGAKVGELIPGRRIPQLTRENLYAEWTRQQVERWQKDHGALGAAEGYAKYASAAPLDAELVAEFPRHITPFAQVRSGKAPAAKTEGAFTSYCPLCGAWGFGMLPDAKNQYHGTTTCCKTELWGREQDMPADYALRPTEKVKFLHLDDTWYEAPCTIYKDKEGVEWELFIRTWFDHKRWLDEGGTRVRQYAQKFEETADPLYVHKVAVLLDVVADTYYGLPLADKNKLCMGKEGKGLTRAEWEAVPRPAIFEVGALGPWGRRMPHSSPGWLNMMDEHIWVEPFGRVRHHPTFKAYSQVKYGDPEALDKKIMEKLIRELALMFKSVFSQKLLTNYQEANYVDMWLLGILAEDAVLVDFAGPAQEVAMYNHTYQDGLNGEGAPNYMAMPGGYFYPFLADPKGWLQYYPKFLEDHPFYHAANAELRKLTTVRGLQIEFGDQHEHAFPGGLITNAAQLRENEKVGSRNWAGYGVGIMRIGGPGHRQELGLTYTRASLHNAQDALGLECWVDGVPVLRRGGYAAYWSNARLQWERPEFSALKQMGYPKEITEGGWPPNNWSWNYAHSPLCQNNLTVDEVGVGAGWSDNRGYGEVITFKGGERAGEPGSGFQVLDVVDHYSWSRVDKKMEEFRRTLIGIEGPDGRPYAVDILKAKGEGRQALYNSAFGDAVELKLPAVKAKAETLEALWSKDSPGVTEGGPSVEQQSFKQVRKVEVLGAPEGQWGVTWKTDVGAYAPRDANGKAFVRPWADNTGQVRLRMVGLPQSSGGQTELIRGQGPWIAWLRQPLPNGRRVDGNVAFLDARDFVIERRVPAAGQPVVDSRYLHVLEGYKEGEASVIRSVTPVEVTSVRGPARELVALQLAFTAGHTDTVLYQSEPGVVRLADGVETDARYALLRRDAKGETLASEMCRGSYLKVGASGSDLADGFEVKMAGDFGGTIVDVIGDLTGTRQESALVIRPDKPWPIGTNLKGRQLLVRYESELRNPGNEGWRVERVTALPDGLVRVDMQDAAPFVVSWHQVTVLPTDRQNVIRTWRPMVDHGNNPWYNGLKLWFPEQGKLYTIKNVNAVGGGYGGDTVELVEPVNLAAEGIKVGDWYVIYGVQPGLQVNVANDFCFRREPATEWKQYGLRATGAVEVKCKATAAGVWQQEGEGSWSERKGEAAFSSVGEQPVMLVADKPAWLNLNDRQPPQVVRLALDGQVLEPEQASDLGWIEAPRRLVLEVREHENPLDLASLRVSFNGQAPAAGVVRSTPGAAGKSLTVEVDLQRALGKLTQTRKHVLEIAVADKSVGRQALVVPVAFMVRMPQDAGALYLSDLKEIRAFAHGGLIKDRDYVGNPAQIADRLYPKCLTLCPEPSPDGPHGEVVYALPADKPGLTLHSDIGISTSSVGNGSAIFMVQVSDRAEGPWQTLYTSPPLRGGQEPLTAEVTLGAAKFLRLYTTDAGDGINSDHAVWGGARLR